MNIQVPHHLTLGCPFELAVARETKEMIYTLRCTVDRPNGLLLLHGLTSSLLPLGLSPEEILSETGFPSGSPLCGLTIDDVITISPLTLPQHTLRCQASAATSSFKAGHN